MMWWGFHWWGMGLMGLFMLLFWGAVIWLIVWAISRSTKHAPHSGEKRDPLDIAKERYAKGEITKEQFEQIKKDLTG